MDRLLGTFVRRQRRRSVGGFHSSEWLKYGIAFRPFKNSTSENYLGVLPALLARRVRLLDNTTLRNQLTSLERTVGAGDKETVTHPKHAAAHDDMSAAVAGAIMAALQAAQRAAQESNAIVAPIFFAGTASAVPGGSSFGSDVLVMPTPAALEASAPILQPSEQPKPVLNSPVAAKSGAETEAQRQRADADRSLGYKITTERGRP